jgi:hypothetical protein
MRCEAAVALLHRAKPFTVNCPGELDDRHGGLTVA